MLGVLLIAVPVGSFIGAVGVDRNRRARRALRGRHEQLVFPVHRGRGFVVVRAAEGHVVAVRRPADLGAAPAAAVGALVNNLIPVNVLWLILSAVTLGSGVYHLLGRARSAGERIMLSTAQAVPIGAAVGFGSALTGTGGPVLLVPVLLALGVAPLTTVAASQVIQLPLVGFATLGYAATGSVRFGLGTLLGVIAGVGVLLGAHPARRLQPGILYRFAAAALVAVGAFLLVVPFIPISQQ